MIQHWIQLMKGFVLVLFWYLSGKTLSRCGQLDVEAVIGTEPTEREGGKKHSTFTNGTFSPDRNFKQP